GEVVLAEELPAAVEELAERIGLVIVFTHARQSIQAAARSGILGPARTFRRVYNSPAMRLSALALLGVVACSLLAACPRSFNPHETGLPSGGAKDAQIRFETARAHFARDAHNAEEFEAIVHDYPDDPIAPYAE